MNDGNKSSGKDDRSIKKSDKLERLARLIDPPGREVSDEELNDPGKNIPDTGRQEEAKPRPPSERH